MAQIYISPSGFSKTVALHASITKVSGTKFILAIEYVREREILLHPSLPLPRLTFDPSLVQSCPAVSRNSRHIDKDLWNPCKHHV